ncbi:cupin domain-containing protein [Chryseobacterium geocarposphaerae]|uniref:Mannose-6-phosphate isomerase n=1 Tax=Chryseobacterium geocarposphaerae TaxID=1416776 RepID=A0A2M9CBT9_9FLAO|nr:hypothetical protein [Chryseobacterium geocarposphaerae]PJJ68254.1 mannose-6-phosphate isomerase [Chryseobacterium geocarposphaerae]
MLEIGERPLGKYYVLADEPNYKLKRIELQTGTYFEEDDIVRGEDIMIDNKK